LKIASEWQNECNELVGFTTYSNGNVVSKSFEPTCYTLEALKEFAKTNDWFDYEDYVADYEEEEGSELRSDVKVTVLTHSYEEFRERMEGLYR
jgi:hypothetical protein